MASEEKLFENLDGRQTDGGRRMDDGYVLYYKLTDKPNYL